MLESDNSRSQGRVNAHVSVQYLDHQHRTQHTVNVRWVLFYLALRKEPTIILSYREGTVTPHRCPQRSEKDRQMETVGTGLKTQNGVFVQQSNGEGTKARWLPQRRLRWTQKWPDLPAPPSNKSIQWSSKKGCTGLGTETHTALLSPWNTPRCSASGCPRSRFPQPVIQLVLRNPDSSHTQLKAATTTSAKETWAPLYTSGR